MKKSSYLARRSSRTSTHISSGSTQIIGNSKSTSKPNTTLAKLNRLGWCYIILKSKNRRLVVSSSEARLMVERRRKTAGIRLFGSKYGMPDTIRTYDLQLRKLTLYPTELRAHMWIVFTNVNTCPPSKIKCSSPSPFGAR